MSAEQKRLIRCHGKELETKYEFSLTNDEYNQIVEAYYAKPSMKDVVQQFCQLSRGGGRVDKITNFYIKDIMAKTKIYYNKWSIEEVLGSKELVEYFMGKANSNKKVCPEGMSNCKKLETILRIGGKGVASKPANFPIQIVDKMIAKYNVNNNYYDYSCGWGTRLMSALRNDVNYFGTDPNYLLTDRLNKMAQDYQENVLSYCTFDIRTQGSELFVPEWENKMGLAFSSPPYFCLEDYGVGNQSYKEGVNYEHWKNTYLKKTFENIYSYLIPNGFMAININDFDRYNLVKDSIEIATQVGFRLYATECLKNIERCNSKGTFNKNSEEIFIFTKDM